MNAALPCCPHPVERHAYNGCTDCGCDVPWNEHPDRDRDMADSAHLARCFQRRNDRLPPCPDGNPGCEALHGSEREG